MRRLKLEFDLSLGIPHDLRRVWFQIDEKFLPCIRDVVDLLIADFEINVPIVLELEGFNLLGSLPTKDFLQHNQLVVVKRLQEPIEERFGPSRKRSASHLDSPPSPQKKIAKSVQVENNSDQRNQNKLNVITRSKTRTQNAKSSSSDSESESDSSDSESSSTSSSSSNSSSSSSSSTSLSDSSSSSASSSSSSSSSSESVQNQQEQQEEQQTTTVDQHHQSHIQDIEEPSKSILNRNARRRMNKRNRIAMLKASKDTLYNISKVYKNFMDNQTSNEDDIDYQNLPDVIVPELEVGDIVGFRTLELSPLGSSDMTPWDQRRVSKIDGKKVYLEAHNPQAYLSSWWLDGNGDKYCTVSEWLKETGQTYETEIAITEHEPIFSELKMISKSKSSSEMDVVEEQQEEPAT